MDYLKGFVLAVGIVYAIGSWVTWVNQNDEHLFIIAKCLSRNRQISHQEAVILCEREVR